METPLHEVTTITTTTATPSAAAATTNTVLKGKRTKRQRVQSPIPFALTADSSSGDGDGNGEGDDCREGDDCSNNNNIVKMSPATACQEFQDQIARTQEEEDMANCLILLAQGHHNDSPKIKIDNHINVAGAYNPIIKTTTMTAVTNKLSSRRLMETGNQCSGKAGGGYYVYECKTCNRTFPSFQALGGHRASHKKPKATNNTMIVNDNNCNYKKQQQFAVSSDEEDGYYRDISSLSLQLSNNNNVNTTSHNISHNKGVYNHQNKGSKIHECSICGAEFNSGQALGGHMRRHRGFVGTSCNTVTNSTTLSLTPLMARSEESAEPKKGRNLGSLDLDLNLPAAPDPEEKLPFASKQQPPQQQQQQQQQPKPPLVFSSPALVDCHY